MIDLYLPFAVGAISYALVDSKIAEPVRQWVQEKLPRIAPVLDCIFCTSWWVSGLLCLLTMSNPFWLPIRIPAMVGAAMIVVLGINLMESTYQKESVAEEN